LKLPPLSIRLLHQFLYLPHEGLVVLLELCQIQLQVTVFFGQAVDLCLEDRVLGEEDEVGGVGGLGDVGMVWRVRVLGLLTVKGTSLVCDLRISFWLFILFLLIKLRESRAELPLPHFKATSRSLS
jgi:hypothetical protein